MNNYPSDLTDTHGVARRWQLIEKMFDTQERERKRKYSLRKILDAIWYVVKGAFNGVCYPRIFLNDKPFIGIIKSGKRMDFRLYYMIR